MRMREER
jgi:hypothetical protein